MKKIIYNQIKLQDFKCFENEQFKFKNTRNKITGKNGVGKSTLAESLVFALTGKSMVGGRLSNEPIGKNSLIKENYNQKILIDINVDDKNYIIEKEIVKASAKKLIINKKTYSKLVDFNNDLFEILGVESYDEFLILSNPKYLNGLPHKQARQYIVSLLKNKDEIEFLSLGNFTTTKEIEYKSLIVEDIKRGISLNQLLESKSDEVKNTGKEMDNIELMINSKQDTLTKISQEDELNNETFEELKVKKEKLQNEIKEIDGYNENVLSHSKENQEISQKIDEITENIRKYNVGISHFEIKTKECLSEIERFKKMFEDLAAKQPSNNCPMCNIESENMKEHFEKEKTKELDWIEENIANHKKQIKVSNDGIEGLKSTIKELENEMKVLETRKAAMSFGSGLEMKATTELNNEISKINETLGSYDAIEVVKNEIKSLKDSFETKSKEFDGLETEKEILSNLLKLKAQHYNDLINNQLETSQVKLFELKKNGNIRDIFTIERDGIKFELLNWAGQINSGIELLVFLQKQKEISLPIFIDNAEAVNQLHRFESQSFELYVNDGILEVK